MNKKFLRMSLLAVMILLTALITAMGVSAQGPEVYDVTREGIQSAYYTVDEEKGYISGIAPGTSVEKLLHSCAPADLTVSAEKLTTGTVLSYTDGETTKELTVIVTGDLNGDGNVSVSDLLLLKDFLLGEALSDTAITAADLSYDGDVTVTDLLKLKSHLLGMEEIRATPNAPQLLLMMPQSTRQWTLYVENIAAYQSQNEQLVTVSAEGVLTAQQAEGSCHVYALDGDGNVLARQLVTVLNEPVTLSVNMTQCQLAKGQSITVYPLFNHPVTPAVTWTSSDETVVTVENGVLTSVNFGTATVTAALDNGSTAEIAVRVAPAIEAMSLERTIYKVKPGHTKTLLLQVLPLDSEDVFLWTSSDPSIATVDQSGVVTGVKYGTVTVTVTGQYSGKTASCKVKVCNVKQVAITFDDGPGVHTNRLLDFLKEQDIRVTFFLVVNRISYFPNAVIREVNEGHEVGYHSYSHTIQTTLGSSAITAEYEKSNKIFRDLTGQDFTVWRAPGGGINARVLSSVPLPHIMWSLDSQDWVTQNSTAVYNSIRYARDGAIILMHDIHSFTVNGAIRAMQEMQAGDYEFVTVTELLSRDGTPPENGVNYNKG